MDMNRENLLILIIILGIIIYRSVVPQRTSVTMMWIRAALLIAVVLVLLYGSYAIFHPQVWQVIVAIILGFVSGIPVGLLRGHHTQVSATDRHGVMRIGPSWQTATIYVGALAVRFAIRQAVPMTSAVGTIVSDGLLFFAVGIVAASYYAIYQKYEALDHATQT
jgi:uncharacterized membrane-anchored protein